MGEKMNIGIDIDGVLVDLEKFSTDYGTKMCIEEGWEIGYHIAEIYNGNGYATEAVNLFLDHIKNNTNLKQIFGIALAANKARRRVLEKCGFELIYEGAGIYQGRKRKIIKAIKHL